MAAPVVPKRLSLVMNKSLDECDQQRLLGNEDDLIAEEEMPELEYDDEENIYEDNDDDEDDEDEDSLETSHDVSSFDFTSNTWRTGNERTTKRKRARRRRCTRRPPPRANMTTSTSFPYTTADVSFTATAATVVATTTDTAVSNRILNKRFVQLLTEIYEIAQVFPYVLSKSLNKLI